MIAIVTDYASFNAQLIRQIGPGSDTEVVNLTMALGMTYEKSMLIFTQPCTVRLQQP